jgi:hypothetical protein
MVELNDINEDFRFKVETWNISATNPFKAWDWTGDWNYVGYGWDRSYFTPGFSDPYDNKWEFRVFVDMENEGDNNWVHLDTLPFTVQPNDFFYDLYTYRSNYWDAPYDHKGYTCYGPIVGGQETGWEYSCSNNNKTSVFYTGESIYGLIKIRDIREDHRFRAQIYKDGTLKNTITTGWNYVSGQWDKAFFWPYVQNATSGSWEMRIAVDIGTGFKEIDKINKVIDPPI